MGALTHRLAITTWVIAALCILPHAAAAPSHIDIFAEVSMRDGSSLDTDVYLPSAGPGPWPSVLIRTPYGRENFEDNAAGFTNYGIAYVVQDTRGGVSGDPTVIPFFDDGWGERQDGLDTVEWVAAQSWSNGRIQMEGSSAMGINSLLAAGSQAPSLNAISIQTAAGSLYHCVAYTGGIYRRSLVEGFLERVGRVDLQPQMVAHPQRDSYWDPVDLESRYDMVDVPVLQVSGWFDLYANPTLEGAQAINTRGGPNARGHQLVIMGPWDHDSLGRREQGELVFPENAEDGEMLNEYINGFRSVILLQNENEIFDQPAFRYYVIGDVDDPSAPGNEWRFSDVWPPPHGELALYLHGEGVLDGAYPTTAEPASTCYVADPSNPIPTRGGATLFNPGGSGPMDQASNEARADVITFTTPVMGEPLEFEGMVRCFLSVSSTAPDADFMVKLMDVYPDGRSMLMIEGAIQARRRNGFDEEDFMVPGEICELEIPVGHIALALNTGHRLRISIASSNWRRFEVNPQTGATLTLDDPVRAVATHTIHHSPAHPSRILLPVGEPSATHGLSLH